MSADERGRRSRTSRTLTLVVGFVVFGVLMGIRTEFEQIWVRALIAMGAFGALGWALVAAQFDTGVKPTRARRLKALGVLVVLVLAIAVGLFDMTRGQFWGGLVWLGALAWLAILGLLWIVSTLRKADKKSN